MRRHRPSSPLASCAEPSSLESSWSTVTYVTSRSVRPSSTRDGPTILCGHRSRFRRVVVLARARLGVIPARPVREQRCGAARKVVVEEVDRNGSARDPRAQLRQRRVKVQPVEGSGPIRARPGDSRLRCRAPRLPGRRRPHQGPQAPRTHQPSQPSTWPTRTLSCFGGPERGAREARAPPREPRGGYWMMQAKSFDEVMEWMKRCPALRDDGSELEIRRLIDVGDFADAGEEANEMHKRLEESSQAVARLLRACRSTCPPRRCEAWFPPTGPSGCSARPSRGCRCRRCSSGRRNTCGSRCRPSGEP